MVLVDSSLIITFIQNSVKTVLMGKWKQTQLAKNQEEITDDNFSWGSRNSFDPAWFYKGKSPAIHCITTSRGIGEGSLWFSICG